MNSCSLNIDNLGVKSIKKSDGITDPNGNIVPNQAYWTWYNGQTFALVN